MRSLVEDRAFQAGLRGSLAVLLVIATVLVLQRTWDVLEPLIVATVLATAIWPWVSRLANTRFGPMGWRLPRLAATSLVFVLTFAIAGAVLWFAVQALLPELERIMDSYPDQTAPLRQYLQPLRTGGLAGGAGEIASQVAQQATSQSAGVTQSGGDVNAAVSAPFNLIALTLGLLGGVVHIALTLVFTFFLLVDGHRCARWVLGWFPLESRSRLETLGVCIRDRISRWVLAQLLYGGISGLIIWVAMWLIGLRTPWIYAIVGATLGIFPGLGPWVAMLPAFVVALGMSVWQATLVAAFGITMYVIDSTTLSTKIYGEMLRLPMFVVLLALFIGAALMGVWGAIIAAPVAAGIQSVLEDAALARTVRRVDDTHRSPEIIQVRHWG